VPLVRRVIRNERERKGKGEIDGRERREGKE
jgi:hypothetical protein